MLKYFKIQFNKTRCTSAVLGVDADLWAPRGDLAEEVQNGGGENGVDAEEEVDAHVGDEGHLRILEHARQQVHPGEGGEPEGSIDSDGTL